MHLRRRAAAALLGHYREILSRRRPALAGAAAGSDGAGSGAGAGAAAGGDGARAASEAVVSMLRRVQAIESLSSRGP